MICKKHRRVTATEVTDSVSVDAGHDEDVSAVTVHPQYGSGPSRNNLWALCTPFRRLTLRTHFPSRLMFCDMAPFSFSMESIILTGSSRFRPDGLLSCRALLVGPPIKSKVLLLCSSDVVVAIDDDAPSVCLPSSVQASVSPGSPAQLSSSTSTISMSLKEFHKTCYFKKKKDTLLTHVHWGCWVMLT